MTSKYIFKNILIGILLMATVSMVSLFVLSALTYHFKWQAPQAQAGITLTYIISGLAGGLASAILNRRDEKRERRTLSQDAMRPKLISGVTLGTMYMAILLALSIAVSGNTNWDMGQILLIWMLLSCSSVLGVFLGTALGRKG